MADYLLITRADGGLSVCALHPEADAQTELAKWESQADPAWLPVQSWRVAVDPIFPSREFRVGWVDDGNDVTVDQNRLTAAAAAALTELRAKAKELFQAAEQSAQRDRAIALAALDEVNALRQWVTDFKASVAAATSLADLKTRVAGLPDLPQRTAAQARTAVLNRIDSTDAE